MEKGVQRKKIGELEKRKITRRGQRKKGRKNQLRSEGTIGEKGTIWRARGTPSGMDFFFLLFSSSPCSLFILCCSGYSSVDFEHE